MNTRTYSQLAGYKQWADRGLYEIVAGNLERLDPQDAAVLVLILDHIHAVDKIFQHHLLGLTHGFQAPRSAQIPPFERLRDSAREVDDWYVSYVGNLRESDFDQPLEFAFTNGTPARMRRGEIILHVCLHGTYHRGNAGILLQKNAIAPNQDRMTDFLETAG